MLDDLRYVLHGNLRDCIIYHMKVFFLYRGQFFFVNAFSMSNVFLYNWYASLNSSRRSCVLWIVLLLGILGGVGIKGLSYDVTGETSSHPSGMKTIPIWLCITPHKLLCTNYALDLIWLKIS